MMSSPRSDITTPRVKIVEEGDPFDLDASADTEVIPSYNDMFIWALCCTAPFYLADELLGVLVLSRQGASLFVDCGLARRTWRRQ